MCLLKMCDKIYFSSKQLETIQEAFDHFDINGDGLISIDELRNVLDSLGITLHLNINELIRINSLLSKKLKNKSK